MSDSYKVYASEEYVDAAVAAAGGTFIVHANIEWHDDSYIQSFTLDKTFAEIVTAYNSGSIPVLIDNYNIVYNLQMVEDSQLQFATFSVYGNSVSFSCIRVREDGTFQIVYTDVAGTEVYFLDSSLPPK